MADDADSAVTMAELSEPPQVRLRRLPLLVFHTLGLVRRAAPRELLVIGSLQAVGGLGLIAPILLGRSLLTDLFDPTGPGSVVSLLAQGGLFLVLFGVAGAASTVAAARDDILSERLNRYVTGRVMDAACAASSEQFETPAFHNRLDRAARSAAMRPHQLAQALTAVLQSVAGVAGVLVALAIISPVVALVTLAAGVPLWIAGVRGGQVLFSAVFRLTPAERERGYLFDLLTQRRSALELRAYGLIGPLRGKWEERTAERVREITDATRRRVRILLTAGMVNGLMVAAILGALLALAATGAMAAPEATAAAGAVLLLAARLRTAAHGTDMLFESAPFMDDLRAFTDSAPESAGGGSDAEPEPVTFDLLRVRGLEFTYPAARSPALCGVDLDIRAGEVIAIVGENGSGKSTLAKVLAHLYRPTAGTISYDGRETAHLGTDAVRGGIAVLLQEHLRYLLTAHDNIRAGRWNSSESVPEAARQAGAEGFLKGLPDGYGTLLGPEFVGGVDLSGGQWQRMALARAFFRGAPFVILDEPASALDPRAEDRLFQSVRTLLSGRTVLLISHRFATVRSADRILVMAGGRVVEQGSHDDLMLADGHYAQMFELQAARYRDGASPV